ncbi:MAG: hypothetical protein MJZ78_07290 [Bacteroidales bacterium]|nr:hypothetical protein [Bacteroidales bacterium]
MSNALQSQFLASIASGDVDKTKSIAKLIEKESGKKSFKEWLKSLTSLFEIHLTVKILGVTIVDFKIPRE